MLKTAMVYVRQIIEQGVIMTEACNVSEIESGQTRFLENGQVRVVWHQGVDSRRERICCRVWSSFGKLFDEPTILVARFKHNGRTASAARIKVENNSNVSGPWMLVYKSFSSEESELFTIGEESDDIIPQRLT